MFFAFLNVIDASMTDKECAAGQICENISGLPCQINKNPASAGFSDHCAVF
jgi:hypothetical protein